MTGGIPMEVVFSYEPFSKQPEYIEANRAFIRSLPLDPVQRLVDLACGTGTMTEIFLESKPTATVMGLDIAADSLAIAREQFQEQGLWVDDQAALNAAQAAGKPAVTLVQGSADELPFESESADMVMMGNSIHMLPDKDKLLQEINRILRPGGLLAFNSVFYVGTFPKGTDTFYTEWHKAAFGVLQRLDKERQAAGLGKITRQRGKSQKAFDTGWMTPSQWAETLERNGFKVILNHERTVMLNQRSFECFAAYGGFVEVAMSGYPVDVASQAYQEAAGLAFQTYGTTELPRVWLEMAGTKTS